jgi:hypothetical protein
MAQTIRWWTIRVSTGGIKPPCASYKEGRTLKEKPILFSTPMVRAIMEDRKTKTRRDCNPQPVINLDDKRQVIIPVNRMHGMIDTLGFYSVEDYIKSKARYQVGDILWVRETWCNINKPGIDPEYYFYADAIQAEDYDSSEWKWKPSIHMPRKAARIFLRVTNVWVERLQDITEEDAKAEGIGMPLFRIDEIEDYGYVECFKRLWDGLNEKRGYEWEKNPWVWVYTFERCEKPGGTE